MKAVVHTVYGSPELLQYRDVEVPPVPKRQVRVKVLAASVNPLDWRTVRADPSLVRIMGAGFFRPKKSGLGADVAGVIDAVGDDVEGFSPGDEVFGSSEGGSGSFAEFVTLPADTLLPKPKNVSFDEAAAVPMAGLTALKALRDVAQVSEGDRVLIQGASGGVGTFAVQLAKYFGAEVTGVTSTRNVDMVRALGADNVVDYTQTDWTTANERYDVILGVAGYHSLRAYARCLAPHGTYVAIGGRNAQIFECLFLGGLLSLMSQKTLRPLIFTSQKEDLEFLLCLMKSGHLRPVIDRHFPLSGVSDALRYVENGHARGKVIVTVP